MTTAIYCDLVIEILQPPHNVHVSSALPPLAQQTSYVDGLPFRGLVSYFRLETLPFFQRRRRLWLQACHFPERRARARIRVGREGVQMDEREGNHRINLGWHEKWAGKLDSNDLHHIY